MASFRTFTIALALLIAALAVVSSCSNQHPIFGQASSSVYQAPLTYSNDPLRIQGSYIISLKIGYHFEEHFARIGTQDHVKDRYDHLPYDAYASFGVHDGLLAVIRADPGVTEVMCNHRLPIEWE